MAVTVQQAAVNALVTYLRAELPDVTVSAEWPASEAELPEQAITVLMAGKRQDTPADAQVMAIDGTGDSRTFIWRVMTSTQPLQLDIWARYPAARDDLLAQLDEALHKGTLFTIHHGVPSCGSWEPTRDGVLLALAAGDGHVGYVDFTFDGADLNDTADAALRHEWRATITGEASMVLTVKTTHPLLRVAGLRLRAGEVPAAMSVESIDFIPGEE